MCILAAPDVDFGLCDKGEAFVLHVIGIFAPEKRREDATAFELSAFGGFDLKRLMPAFGRLDSKPTVEGDKFAHAIGSLF
jgi:hypothetical protein